MVLRFILIFLGSMLVAACEFNFEEETLSKRVDETKYYYEVFVSVDQQDFLSKGVILEYFITQKFLYQTDQAQNKSQIIFHFSPSRPALEGLTENRILKDPLGYTSGLFYINYSDTSFIQDSVKMVIGDKFHQDSLWIVFPRQKIVEVPLPKIDSLRVETLVFGEDKIRVAKYFVDTRNKRKLIYFLDKLGYSADVVNYSFWFVNDFHYGELRFFSFQFKHAVSNRIHFTYESENAFWGIDQFTNAKIFGIKLIKKEYVENRIKNDFIIGKVTLIMPGVFSE